MNTIFIVAICVFLVLFFRSFGLKIEVVLFNTLLRCLSGLVIIYICNFFLSGMGQNLTVKINEISLCISAVLGISGVFFLYCFQWFLTITG